MSAPTPDAIRYEEACAKVREAFRNESTPSPEQYAEARRLVDSIDPPWSGATYNIWRQELIEKFAGKIKRGGLRPAEPVKKRRAA